MPTKPGKSTLGVTVTDAMRSRIKNVADARHWSLSQAVGLFLERYWDEWEKELGITPAPSEENKEVKKSRAKGKPQSEA